MEINREQIEMFFSAGTIEQGETNKIGDALIASPRVAIPAATQLLVLHDVLCP